MRTTKRAEGEIMPGHTKVKKIDRPNVDELIECKFLASTHEARFVVTIPRVYEYRKWVNT